MEQFLSKKSILSQFHLFTPKMLEHAAFGYEVKILHYDEKSLIATCDEAYNQILYLRERRIAGMACNCESHHEHCVHLASVLVHLQKFIIPNLNSQNEEKQVPPILFKSGNINQYREILNVDKLIDLHESPFPNKAVSGVDMEIMTNQNNILNITIVEKGKNYFDRETTSHVKLKWSKKKLFAQCDCSDSVSTHMCRHQVIALAKYKVRVIQNFILKDFDVDPIYASFNKVQFFQLEALKQHFDLHFTKDDYVYLKTRTEVELVNNNWLESMEDHLILEKNETEARNELIDELYKNEQEYLGNAILWSQSGYIASIRYLEGKLAKNKNKLISHIDTVYEPGDIPFSIQQDLKKLDGRGYDGNRYKFLLSLDAQLKFLQSKVAAFNEYLNYFHLDHSIMNTVVKKKDLALFTFMEKPLRLSINIREEEHETIIVTLLFEDFQKNEIYDALTHKCNYFLYNQSRAHVFYSATTFGFISEFGKEKNFLFSKKDLQTLRKGISRFINYYQIDPTQLDSKFVQPISTKHRIIVLSQHGNRIHFTPQVRGPESSQIHFNILSEQCQPAEEEPFYIRIPNRKVSESFQQWFDQLHSKMDKLTAVMGFHSLHLQDFTENQWFLEFTDMCEKAGIEVTGWENLNGFSFNPNRGEFEQVITDHSDWFDIHFTIRFGDITVPQKDWIRAVRKGERSILLKDGSYGIIPEEWRLRTQRLLNSAEITKDSIQLSKLLFNAIDQYVDLSNDPKILKEIQEKKARLAEFKEMKTFALPKSIQAELRPYQKEGYNWLKFLNEYQFGGCLADDMGLGKTLQILCILADQKRKNRPASLVVVPRSLMYNWVSEIEKFSPTMTYLVHHGAQRSSSTADFSNYDIIISTYGTMTNDIEWVKNYKFHYVVLDESQAIKNPSSMRYRSIMQLSGNYKLTLTGTPIENSTMDLYAQFNFINPGLLGTKSQFRKQFSDPIEKSGDSQARELLQKIIHPFLLRRTKSQVTRELPPKTEVILYCEMEGYQKTLYHKVKNEIRANLLAEDNLERNKIKVLEGLLKLRQICNSPSLVEDEKGIPTSVKIESLMEQIDEVVGQENHSILVFSQFTSMLALIKERLDDAGYSYTYLDGSTTNRKAVIDEFNTNENIKIFLLSLKAGNVGLNLTKADFVYLIDPWWNPAVETQAIDRTHRIGQTKPVFAYRMICKDSVEEKILKLQSKKNKLAEDLIQTDENVFKSLNKDELISLFE